VCALAWLCQKGEQTESENLDEDLVSFLVLLLLLAASVNEILHKLLALDGHFPSFRIVKQRSGAGRAQKHKKPDEKEHKRSEKE
jgi:hypothetical protein